VANACDAGGEVLTGGQRIEGPGNFVQPTVIKARNEWEIVRQETFAPILYVIPFTDLADAIRMQNDVRQGLSSAIFTSDLRHAELFLSSVGSDCGIANVNIGTSGAEIGGAFINWGNELPLAQGIRFEL
jgi:aldehyde dehydrogenase (NAD+)